MENLHIKRRGFCDMFIVTSESDKENLLIVNVQWSLSGMRIYKIPKNACCSGY
jgi:hypothetical protein